MRKLVLVLVVCFACINSVKAENVKPIVKSKISEWINNHLTYPESAIKNSEEGIVYVSFELLENGKVSNARIEQGISPSLNEEAISVVKAVVIKDTYSSTTPNKRYILPIKFTLK